jgi:hypothetical protein
MLDVDVLGSIGSYLNSDQYLEDPLGANRRVSDNHFYTSMDGINLRRYDTFPKGYIYGLNETDIISENLGDDVKRVISDAYIIDYYALPEQKYTRPDTSEVIKNEKLVQYMLDRIEQALLSHDGVYELLPLANPKVTKTQTVTRMKGDDTGGRTSIRGTLSVSYMRRQ